MHLNPKSQRSEMDDEELTMMALEIMQDTHDPLLIGGHHNHYGHQHSHKLHNKQSVHKAYNIHINSPIEKSIHSNHKNKISPNIPYQTQRQRQQQQQNQQNQQNQQQQQYLNGQHQNKEPSQTYSHLNPSYISDGIMARSYSASSEDGDMVYVDYPRSIQGSGTRSGALGISNLASNDTNPMTISHTLTQQQNIDDHKANHHQNQSVHDQYQKYHSNQQHQLSQIYELSMDQSQDISIDLDDSNDTLPQSHQPDPISDDKITIVSQLSTNDSLRGEILPPIPMTPNSYNIHQHGHHAQHSGQYHMSQQYGQYPVSPNQLYDMVQNVDPNTAYANAAANVNTANVNETHHKNGPQSKSTNRSSGGSKGSKQSVVTTKYGNKKRGIKRFTNRQKNNNKSHHKSMQSQPMYSAHPHTQNSIVPTTNIMYSATYDQAVPNYNHNISPSPYNNNISNHINHNGNIQPPSTVRHNTKYRKNKVSKSRHSNNHNHTSPPIAHRPKSIPTNHLRRQPNNQRGHGPLSIMSSPPQRGAPPNSVRYISVEDTTDHELENEASLPSIRHIDISPSSGSKILFAKRQNKKKNMPPKSPHTPPPKHTKKVKVNLADNALSPQSVPVTTMAKDTSHQSTSLLSPKSPDDIRYHDKSTSHSTLNAVSPIYSTGKGSTGKGTTDCDQDDDDDDDVETAISPLPGPGHARNNTNNISININADNLKPSYSEIDTTPNLSPFATVNKRRRKSHRSRSNFTPDNDHRNDYNKSMEQQSRDTGNICMKPVKPHETNSVVSGSNKISSRSKSKPPSSTPRNHRKSKKSKKDKKSKKSHKRRKEKGNKLNRKKAKHQKFKSDGLQFIHNTVKNAAEKTSTLPLAKLERIGSRLSLSPTNTNSPNAKNKSRDEDREEVQSFVPGSRGPSFPAKQEFDGVHSGNAQKRKKKVLCICGSKLTKMKLSDHEDMNDIYCSKCGQECIDTVIYYCKAKENHKNGYNLCLKCVKKQKKKTKTKSKIKSKKLKQKKAKTRKYRSDELYKIDRNYQNEPVLLPNIPPFIQNSTSKSNENDINHGHKQREHGHMVNNKYVPSTKKKVHTITIEHDTDQFAVNPMDFAKSKSKSPSANTQDLIPMPMNAAGSGSGSSGRSIATSTGSPKQPPCHFVKRGPVSTQGFGQVNPFRSAQSQPPMSYLGDLEDDIIRSPREALQQQLSIIKHKQDHGFPNTAHNNDHINSVHHDRRSNTSHVSRHSHGNGHNGHRKGAKNKRKDNKKDHDHHVKSMTVASPICLSGNEFTWRADYDSSHSRQSGAKPIQFPQSTKTHQRTPTSRKHKKGHNKHSHRGHSHERKHKHSIKIKQHKNNKDKQQTQQQMMHNPVGYFSKNIDPNNPFSPSFGATKRKSKYSDTNVIEYDDGNEGTHSHLSSKRGSTAFNFPQPGQQTAWNPGHKQMSSRKSKKNKHSKRNNHHKKDITQSITPSPQVPNKRERGYIRNDRYGKRNKKHNQRSKTPRPTKYRKSKSPSRRINNKIKRKRSNSIAASNFNDDTGDITDNEYAIETEDGFIFVARSEYDRDMEL